MAQQKFQSVAVLVPVALIAWREINNYRSDVNYGDMDDIRNSLAASEWVTDNPIPAVKITDSERLAEMAEREAKWKELREATVPESVFRLKVFEMLYVKDGKLVVPSFSANAGFRRGRCFFEAMVQRFKKNGEKVPRNEGGDGTQVFDLPIHGLIPIRETSYPDEIERIIDQQLENEMQAKGQRKMDDLDKLRVTKFLFDQGCREVKIRRLYPGSTAQKLFAICLADRNWPELHIYDRIQSPSNTSDHIKWGPIRHNDLGKFNQRLESQKKKDAGFELSKDDRANLANANGPVTAKEVNEYFVQISTEGAPNPKGMTRSTVNEYVQNHKLDVVREVMKSVANNGLGNLKTFVEHSDAMNGVFRLVQSGKGDAVDTVVKAASTSDDGLGLLEQCSKIISLGRAADLRKAIQAVLAPATTAPVTAPAATANGSTTDAKSVLSKDAKPTDQKSASLPASKPETVPA